MNQEIAYTRIEKFYRENREALTKRFYKYYGDMARAEDTIQEGFTRALLYWKNMPEDETHLTAYMNTILNNAGKNLAKQERLHGAVDTKDEAPEEAAPDAIIPEVIYKQVMARVDQQREPVRSVLRYFFLDNMKVKNITELTNLSASSVKGMVFKFREGIRKDFRWSI